MLHDEEFLIGRSGYHYLPYMHATISYLLIGAMLIVAIVFLIYKRKMNICIATSISINVIYVMCYFFPAMLLAFIHDPLLTIFTCFMDMAFVSGFYTIVWSVSLLVLSGVADKLFPQTKFSFKIMIYAGIISMTSSSIFYFLSLIVGMISLGSFSDFQTLKNDMILPLVAGLLTFFILKSAYKRYAKVKLNGIMKDEEAKNDFITKNKVDEVCITINQTQDDHDQIEIEGTNSQNDENTTV